MSQPTDLYLTTKELADLLRIKERKVYDLAASGDVPCVRVVGKLLFPRTEIEAWMTAAKSGPTTRAEVSAVFAGSHDPLLEWALRESGCGIAAMFDGSFDGLKRFSDGQALACGLHIHEADGWNLTTVQHAVGDRPVVMIGFAERQRGLIVAKNDVRRITGIGDLIGRSFARRQDSSASHQLFKALATAEGVDPSHLTGPQTAARTEDDVGLMVLEGQADAALGLAGVAARLGLGFVPLLTERFDLLVWRHAYFEPPFQALLAFFRSGAFRTKATGLAGYDISDIGVLRLNGAAR
ncbi:MAG: helix-turn-helix transcriptional regulator [Paracoccaceae bacterium]